MEERNLRGTSEAQLLQRRSLKEACVVSLDSVGMFTAWCLSLLEYRFPSDVNKCSQPTLHSVLSDDTHICQVTFQETSSISNT